MARLPQVTATELMRTLERSGWVRVSQSGSHVQMRRMDGSGRVTVPVHQGRILDPKTLKSILAQVGWTSEELGHRL